MKKKIYFIMAAIIQMIVSAYTVIKAKVINEELLSSIPAVFPKDIQERIINLYQNVGVKYIIVLAIICILIDLYIIYIACTNKLSAKKGAIITLSVISLFTASYSIVELVAIVNVIVMLSYKNERTNVVKEKKEIPKLDREKSDRKKIILSWGLILVYFSQRLWSNFIPQGIIGLVITITFYLVMIFLSIFVFFDKFTNDFNLFRKNFKVYMGYILPKMAIFYLIFIVVSFASMMIAKATATNQDLVKQLPILLSLPLAIIYAPIVEETLFRGCIRRFISNDKIFILVSGIIFGLLHTIFSEATLFNIIVLSLPYGAMGGFLAYIYVKTNNMMSNMTCHALNNTVAMFFSVLITRI